MAEQSSTGKKKWGRWLRLGAGIALLAYVLWRIDLGAARPQPEVHQRRTQQHCSCSEPPDQCQKYSSQERSSASASIRAVAILAMRISLSRNMPRIQGKSRVMSLV